jgi:hypothetical protein
VNLDESDMVNDVARVVPDDEEEGEESLEPVGEAEE